MSSDQESKLQHCADWPFSAKHKFTFEAPVVFRVRLPNAEEYYAARHVNAEEHRFQPFEEIVAIIEMYELLLEDKPRSLAKLKALKSLLHASLDDSDIKRFIKFVDEFRALAASFKELKKLEWPLPETFAHNILEATYSRVVSPRISLLRRYKSFSRETYGELMPSFVSSLFRQMELGQGQLFVDLGSGVGNCVCQAAMEFGCEAFGIELLENPHQMALEQAEELASRTKAWGVKLGNIQFVNGSIDDWPDLDTVLAKSSVILANNLLFDGALNNCIRDRIEKLAVGKKIASLQPFFKTKQNTTILKIDDSRSFCCRKYQFPPGSVTWASCAGDYYITEIVGTR